MASLPTLPEAYTVAPKETVLGNIAYHLQNTIGTFVVVDLGEK